MKRIAVRILAVSVLAIAPLSGPCFAQQGRESGENANTLAAKSDVEMQKAREEAQRQSEIDAAYKAGLARQKPNAAASTDPWADVRTTPPKSSGH